MNNNDLSYDNTPFLVGDWYVSPGTCTVSKKTASTSIETKVTPRSMDVLRLLIKNAGNVVAPAEFLNTIWRTPIATDHAVHKAIAELRSALEDDAHHPRYIKTVPKRGYALIAEVCEATAGSIQPAGADSPAGAGHTASQNKGSEKKGSEKAGSRQTVAGRFSASLYKRAGIAVLLCGLVLSVPMLWRSSDSSPAAEGVVRLAVLPFAARDFSDENQILSEGIRESLIHGLAKIGHLQISSPVATRVRNASISEERSYLRQSDHVLQGSVMTGDGRIRVTVQLVRIADGVREYSDQFDLPMDDIFAVQDQIVSNVVSALSVYLNDSERSEMRDWGTTNALAYERFLRGEFYNNQYNPVDWKRAIMYHKAAIDLDPQFLNAYHGLATAANNLAVHSSSDTIEEMHELVLDVHREISRIDPDSPILTSIDAIRLRLRGSSYTHQETQLREQILSGQPPPFAMAHYALLLIGARLYDEAQQFLSLVSEAGPFEISPDEAWNYRNSVLTPSDSILSHKNQLLKRPFHISGLGSTAVNLAVLGDFRQAQVYLNQQREVDLDGILSHYTENMVAVLSGKMRPGSDAYLAAFKDDVDFYYNNGVLAFTNGDLERGLYYWQNLEPVHLRRLFNVTHMAEKYFPEEILASPDYQNLLESLGAGISWQQRLMKGVMEMEPVTGIGLSPSSRAAFDRQVMLVKNNLWSEQEWAEFQHHRHLRTNQFSSLPAARIQ